ncbi:type II toxin-antitoxin system death-on-curing family toxin [Nocardiopsis sp. HNM0947]|uniref:Type II toxin-antitoxin system death-on-curing family toxin n=1 Tax=Nocardiopsis coralli TaxID=2772213 RepID=A0ABR9P5Z6_9ACTN|nr:type II toxin-antitoxin system death-on-curing family toxin [Nocardiopsis coralli]MBE2999271.1 type II toxin-antitoxin system death-on-curing family toxin [Nocardiopsis coralli]
MSGEAVRYLTRNDLLAVIEAALPASTRLRDPGQLQSAMVRPQTTAFGEDAYPDLWEKAAALMQSLLIGHPLNDGNKRLAWVAAKTFLRLNGTKTGAAPTDASYDLVISVTTGEIMDVPTIAAELRTLLSTTE